jgi:hypothetical protein
MRSRDHDSPLTGFLANMGPMADDFLGHFGASAMPAPLPVSEGLYYRLHGRDEEFGPEHASTQNIGEPPSPDLAKYWEPKPGYSAFWHPHHLAQYLSEMGWNDPGELRNSRVVAFRGRPIGEGADGEPRVMPDSGGHDSMPWHEFEERLDATPGPGTRWHQHTWGEGPNGQMVDDGYRTIGGHTAAVRPGRGEKQCSCCSGNGEHGDGTRCDRCDGRGSVSRETSDPHCPGQPQPRRRHWRGRTAAADLDPEQHLPGGTWDERHQFYRARVPLVSLITNRSSMDEVVRSGRQSETPGERPWLKVRADMPGRYEIADGHHRVADAFRRGETHIEADIDPTPDEEPYSGPFYDFGQHRNVSAAAQDGGMAWYHGSTDELAVGDPVRTAAELGRPTRGGPGDEHRVWLSTDPIRAGAYGAHIYEVIPGEPPVHTRGPGDEHDTAGATVVREVPYDEARALSPSYREQSEAYERTRGLQAEAATEPGPVWVPAATRRESVRHILDHYLPSDYDNWDPGDARL